VTLFRCPKHNELSVLVAPSMPGKYHADLHRCLSCAAEVRIKVRRERDRYIRTRAGLACVVLPGDLGYVAPRIMKKAQECSTDAVRP